MKFLNCKFFTTAITLTLITLTFILASGVIYASDCININGESSDKNTNIRPFVCFNHDSHNEKAGIENCYQCHHIYDKEEKIVEGESSEGQSCSECHAKNGGLTNSGGLNKIHIELIAKYHTLCRDCHLSEKRGPVVCGECHKK